MRGKGEGTIRHRPDGRYEGRYTAADGCRRSVFAHTQREAQDRLRAALVTSSAGIAAPDGRMTVGAWLDTWLATSVAQRCRPSTAANYAIVVRLYIKPAVGRIPLAKLTPEHVTRMLAGLAQRRRACPPPRSGTPTPSSGSRSAER